MKILFSHVHILSYQDLSAFAKFCPIHVLLLPPFTKSPRIRSDYHFFNTTKIYMHFQSWLTAPEIPLIHRHYVKIQRKSSLRKG